jgi:hypothetical protein
VLDGQLQDPGVARIEGEELEEPPRASPIHGADVVEQVVRIKMRFVCWLGELLSAARMLNPPPE